MFSTLGHFSTVICPNLDECDLLHCIFSHTPKSLSAEIKTAATPVVTVQDEEDFREHRGKRRKLDSPTPQTLVPNIPKDKILDVANERREPVIRPDHIQDDPLRITKLKKENHKDDALQVAAKAPVSPPPLQKRAPTSKALQKGAKISREETLNPRQIPRDPVGHAKRFVYLKKLYEEMVRLNREASRSDDPTIKSLTVPESEMIKLALDEEEDLVRKSPETYSNLIKLRMVAYKKMTLEQWKTERLRACEAAQNIGKPTASEGITKSKSNKELTWKSSEVTPKVELAILEKLEASPKGLEQYGYIFTKPTLGDIAAAKAGAAAAGGWEQCARCKTRFQVYPERRPNGSLTSGGTCLHHYGRIIFPRKDSMQNSTAVQPKTYSCCNEPVGTSAGCTRGDCHVFKIEHKDRLASVMQFANTPENPTSHSNLPAAVSFDCEMGYTVFGMELIRLTVLNWPEGRQLVDILVRPQGAILDLNTRFSGVTHDQYRSARPYTPNGSLVARQASKENMERETKPSVNRGIPIVESVEAAREVFFTLLTPKTIVIGHAIENDLNAVRVIHPRIVDTVLLYPMRSGLPYRRSLKTLAKELLDRDIQISGAAGHDSSEDAKATGDLVRVKVGQKWLELKQKGWTIVQGALMGPSPGR